MKHLLSFCLLASLVLTTNFTFACENHEFHRVAAKEGDGIFSLLRRYNLADYPCNVHKFYELNKLKRNAALHKGKKYYIPVLLYTYNGKSIRSTIGVDEWQRALRIKKYNEKILKEKLRRKTFQKSRILWVPYHEVGCNSPVVTSSTRVSKPVSTRRKKEKIEKIEVEPGAIATNVPPLKNPEVLVTDPQLTQEELDVLKTVQDPKPREEPVLVAQDLHPEDDKTAEMMDLANTAGGKRQFPIFGKKYSYTPLKSNKLRGRVYYIVAGHGGPDPGAIGKRSGHQLCEDEYAYDVSLRLCRNLVAHGATAYMINRDPNDGIRDGKYLRCDYDEVLWGNVRMSKRHKPRLFQRSDIINILHDKHEKQNVKSQTLIAVHIDSRNQKEQTDLFFYYFPGENSAKQLAYNLHKTMERNYKKYQKNRGYQGTVSPRDLHMLRETQPTSVYIELGNIRNHFDQQRFVLKGNRDALAKWLFEGLTE